MLPRRRSFGSTTTRLHLDLEPMFESNRLLALVVVLVTSCGPSAPSSFPRNSAASDLAEEAPLTPVGLALREDPPLPGQSTAGWSGLGGNDAGATGASMDHSMGGMDMKGMDMSGVDMSGMDMGAPKSRGLDSGHDGH